MTKLKMLESTILILSFLFLVSCEKEEKARFIGLEGNVSIINLIATPSRYQDKAVRIVGYAKIGLESSAVFLSEDDAKYHNISNAVWLDLAGSDESHSSYTQFSNQWVMIEGVFDTDTTGHLGLYVGSMVEIQRLELMKVSGTNE